MEKKYYSCKEREDLMKVISFDGNYYEDEYIIIDVVGKVNTTPSVYDEEGNILEEKEPTWTDFLFNVIFKTDNKKELFIGFEEKVPETPFRTFL